MSFENSLSFARQLDFNDPLKRFRSHFYIPVRNSEEVIYFCGNSLGLQPKSVRTYFEQELLDWEQLGVEGHFKARNPWMYYHHRFKKPLANIVGALPEEVAAMNQLTVNLHLMMVSFYRPDRKRFKIMVEDSLFPSDRYAVQSQLRFHGFDPEEGLIELKPAEGEHTLRTADILEKIEAHREELALVMLGGVNYYTGQLFDMARITEYGHRAGAFVGFDLAHAAGNVMLNLHDWNVDFAVWCSYKYLNSGPGAVAGAFVHARHHHEELPRFNGWWGNEEESRFEMRKEFRPAAGIDRWQLSNAPVFNMVAHAAALDLFEVAGMELLRQKSEKLTAYLEFLLEEAISKGKLDARIITPPDPLQRGAQLSILTGPEGKQLYNKLEAGNVIADWREPNVIRVAPVPLYNKFEEVYRFVEILSSDWISED